MRYAHFRFLMISKSSFRPHFFGFVKIKGDAWWLIPLSKWVITPVINGISRVNPLITGVITHLLSGMSHQVWIPNFVWKKSPGSQFLTQGDAISSERPLRGPAMAPCLPGKPTARTGNVYHGVVSLCYLQWICTLVHIFSVCLEIEGE